MPVNALQLLPLKVFTQRNVVADFLREKPMFIQKMGKVAFEAPFWKLEATYAVYLRLIGKLVGDFLLVIIELFFARCFSFVTVHVFDRQTDGQTFAHHHNTSLA